MKMEQKECSETLAYKIQTAGNYTEKKHMTFRTRQKFEIKNNINKFTVPKIIMNTANFWFIWQFPYHAIDTALKSITLNI
jgi:hypothetical protein